MLTDKLTAKQAQARALTKKLDRSIALEYLWPEVFDNGRARGYWLGTQPNYVAPDLPLHREHEYIITDGKGDKRYFKFDDVPELLGGGYEGVLSK